MDRQSYRALNAAQTLVQDFPLCASTDTVVISIYNVDAGTADVNSAAMTYVTGFLWKYTWTPTLANLFRIDYYNQTMDIHYYEYAFVTGIVSITPSGGLGTSTLTTLRSRFLRLVDNYNANDLSGTNSSGDIADLCINDGLQLIYSILKASKFLEAYGSTSLVSVASQSYIELSGITDLDDIISIKDTTNQITLEGITKDRYFRQVPNPANSTGTPYRFCRIFNRIYLDPQPTGAITYTTEYLKSYPRLASDSDTALIPTKFDDWIMKEARVLWYMMEDANSVPSLVVNERNEAREIYTADALSGTQYTLQAGSFFANNTTPRLNPYDHP